MKIAIAALLLAIALPTLAESSMPSSAASQAVQPGLVDGATAKALVGAGAKVVDVRTPQEFASGHVPGAINIPYEDIARRAAEIGPPSTPVVLYCRTGRRSGIAAEALQKAGYSRLYDFKSVTAWPGELAR
ncbi:MAG: Rhodanese-like protein [Anaeromyxobacteraceae bacterium]|jgi:rhodanese-related sulfurtransferase|nr:Rhodanese-like protein [Anaeromyxobacteraceae bacterium]